MQAGDAEHGVVYAVLLEAAVAENLPGLHEGEGVADMGADLAVGGIVLLFPGWEFGLVFLASVRDDQAGAPVAAVGDQRGTADGVLGSGQFLRLGVVAVISQCSAEGGDQPRVGVDDDLVMGGVPVVFRPLGDHVVAGWDEGAVHDQRGVAAEPLAGPQCEQGAEMVDEPVSRRLGQKQGGFGPTVHSLAVIPTALSGTALHTLR